MILEIASVLVTALCAIVAVVWIKKDETSVQVVVKNQEADIRIRLRKMGGVAPDDLANLVQVRGLTKTQHKN